MSGETGEQRAGTFEPKVCGFVERLKWMWKKRMNAESLLIKALIKAEANVQKVNMTKLISQLKIR